MPRSASRVAPNKAVAVPTRRAKPAKPSPARRAKPPASRAAPVKLIKARAATAKGSSAAAKSAPSPGAAAYSPAKHDYDVHPSIAAMQQWIATLKDKTGRTVDEWMSHCRKNGPKDESACRQWLKDEHGLGTNIASWVAEKAFHNNLADDTPAGYLRIAQSYVDGMYAGPKAALRPIYDALVNLARSLGPQARLCPCKTMVPIFREHVIANITPSTKTRIDLGLCLRGVKAGGRLIDTGGEAKKDRITHRVEIRSLNEIDAEVVSLLRRAWEADA